MGLDPRTPGSCPGPKAGAQYLSHPGVLTDQNLSKPEYTLVMATIQQTPWPFSTVISIQQPGHTQTSSLEALMSTRVLQENLSEGSATQKK